MKRCRLIELEPDQQESVEKVAQKMRDGCRSVLLQGATGSGKSVISTAILQRAALRGKSSMFIVPRRDLVSQMVKNFNKFELPYSFIAAGFTRNPVARNFICSADTMKMRLDSLTPPDLAVIDETHFGGDGLDRIIKWLKAGGSRIIGLSATPWKMSGKGLGCWYDDMVCGPSIRWLIDNKRLAEYELYAPSRVDLSGVAITGGDYAKGQLADRMEQDRVLIGNSVAHYKKHAMGKLGVTFAVSRKHSEMLAQEYRDKGIPAMHVDGETPLDERRRIFQSYARRELLQLCCAELLTFGFDIADAAGMPGVTVECITDDQPTKSLAKQKQKYGRGLRYDGTTHLFFDHANNNEEHGLPDEEFAWTLEDREKKPREASKSTLAVVQCPPPCYFCYRPAPACPHCGAVREIKYREVETVDGELEKINADILRKEKRMEVGKVRTGRSIQAEAAKGGHPAEWMADEMKKSRAAISAIATERGYRKGWVYKQMQLKGLI